MPPAGYNTTRLHAGNGLLVPYNLVSNSQRLGARHPAVPETPKLRGISPDIQARVILSERTEGRPPIHLEVVQFVVVEVVVGHAVRLLAHPVGRVSMKQGGLLTSHQRLHRINTGRITTHQPVIAKLPNIAELRPWFLRRLGT